MSVRGSILVADDDAAIRTVLNQALSRVGHDVRVTSKFYVFLNVDDAHHQRANDAIGVLQIDCEIRARPERIAERDAQPALRNIVHHGAPCKRLVGFHRLRRRLDRHGMADLAATFRVAKVWISYRLHHGSRSCGNHVSTLIPAGV